MLPHEIVLRLRDLFRLQNTIHWIKAITIEDDDGVAISRGHFKPISSPRYLNDCHEYVFHLTPERDDADRSARARCSLSRTRATSRDGRIPAEAIAAAAAIPGSFPIRRSRVATKNGRIRPHFRSSWLNVHQAARRRTRRRQCSIRFSASEIPPSPRNDAG